MDHRRPGFLSRLLRLAIVGAILLAAIAIPRTSHPTPAR